MLAVPFLFFALIGLLVAYDAGRTLYPRFVSGRWVKVVAKVAYAGAQHHDDGGYTAWLVYDYIYHGKKFRSPMTHVDWPIHNAAEAQAFEQMWNRSRSHDIWVNDEAPHISLVSLDKWESSAVVFSVALLATGFLIYFSVVALAG